LLEYHRLRSQTDEKVAQAQGKSTSGVEAAKWERETEGVDSKWCAVWRMKRVLSGAPW
jgi:hypothetical protein